MSYYWYDHNPSLTMFYNSILLLEKSYQFFIDDSLFELNYKPYNIDTQYLLEKFKKSNSENILILSFTYLTKNQSIMLMLKINKKINEYLKRIEQYKLSKEDYNIIKQISNRLYKEQTILESIIKYNKFADLVTDGIMKVIMIQLFKQWKELMDEDYHGYTGFKRAISFIKK